MCGAFGCAQKLLNCSCEEKKGRGTSWHRLGDSEASGPLIRALQGPRCFSRTEAIDVAATVSGCNIRATLALRANASAMNSQQDASSGMQTSTLLSSEGVVLLGLKQLTH